MTYGTLSVLDTLAASTTTSIAQFGEDRAYEAVSVALAAHDAILADLIQDIAEPTADRLRRTGANSSMTAQELDEYGVPCLPLKREEVGLPTRR